MVEITELPPPDEDDDDIGEPLDAPQAFEPRKTVVVPTPATPSPPDPSGVADGDSASPWLMVEGVFGQTGTEIGEFDNPWGIAVLATGELCVAERGGPRVQAVGVPSQLGVDSPLRARQIVLPDDVSDIQDVCVDGATVWVADMGAHRVLQLDSGTGEVVGELSDPHDPLSYPRALALLVDAADDEGNGRPGKGDGGGGSGTDGGGMPAGGSVAGDGVAAGGGGAAAIGPKLPTRQLYVCDSGNGRVMAYETRSRQPVRQIGERVEEVATGIFVPGRLEMPLGLCAHNGEIFVVDGYQHCISVFAAANGRFVRSIGTPGGATGELKSPFGAIIVRGMLVVSEATRVQVFTLDGVHRCAIDVPGADNLAGMCADDERIYVCDVSLGRIAVLRIGWTNEGDRYADQINE